MFGLDVEGVQLLIEVTVFVFEQVSVTQRHQYSSQDVAVVGGAGECDSHTYCYNHIAIIILYMYSLINTSNQYVQLYPRVCQLSLYTIITVLNVVGIYSPILHAPHKNMHVQIHH